MSSERESPIVSKSNQNYYARSPTVASRLWSSILLWQPLLLNSHTLGVQKDPTPALGRRSDRLQKLVRPVLTTGCSQQDFGFFKDEWRRYAASTDTQNDALLRDHLLQCAETGLRKTLQNTIGADRMSTITVIELMKEIEKAAVEKQSDLLNKVKLMEAKEEREI